MKGGCECWIQLLEEVLSCGKNSWSEVVRTIVIQKWEGCCEFKRNIFFRIWRQVIGISV